MLSDTAKADQMIEDERLLLCGAGNLDAFIRPQSIALVGASERPGSVGRTLLANLLAGPYSSRVFPVNPQHTSVLGRSTYPTVGDVPIAIDLCVIATPAESVPKIVRQCVERGVRGAIVISAGFSETGDVGQTLEHRIKEARQGSSLRIVGPNCLGVMAPHSGLNATFAASPALLGRVALLSQSGALLTAILDWSLQERIGFSAVVSLGSMIDVSWGDWIDFLGDDPHTDSIVLYMESIGDARGFLSAARAVAPGKPIIVLKAGRTPVAAKAATSHTGALAGSDEVLDAVFRRAGVLRVDRIEDLFSMAEVLAKQPRPGGRRLMIVTNAGGPGVLATDALLQFGGQLAELSAEAVQQLDRILPRHWSRNNPVDILGDASPQRYGEALSILEQEQETDGHLVILTPQSMTHPDECAQRVRETMKACRKPVLASWMGGAAVAEGRRILADGNVATFEYPEIAAQAFCYMWKYQDSLRALYETPSAVTDVSAQAREAVERILESARAAGRTLLNEVEAKQIIAAYGIPIVDTCVATSCAEAVALANRIGFPVVIKLFSLSITHKSAVGGVKLNIGSAAEVSSAFAEIEAATAAKAGREHFAGVTVQTMVCCRGYELILGSMTDQQFGPVLLFGAGGTSVEVFRDRALGFPPVNTTLALRMMEQTRIFPALQSGRGERVNLTVLQEALVRLSQLVVDHPHISEIDVNPVLASSDGLIALDARIVLHDISIPPERLPRPAIKPYPDRYTFSFSLASGQPATIRAIRPDDEPILAAFHATLSMDSVYRRYNHVFPLDRRTLHERLSKICFADYDRDMVLVVETGADGTDRKILAVGRLSRIPSSKDCELAIIVSDAFQRQGIGRRLIKRLARIATQEGMHRILACFAADNVGMRRLCELAQFDLQTNDGGTIARRTLNVSRTS